jgi:hypothetical protein
MCQVLGYVEGQKEGQKEGGLEGKPGEAKMESAGIITHQKIQFNYFSIT